MTDQTILHSTLEAIARAHNSTGPDLRHHGDTEATGGLVDFAVNVYDGPRPGWLDDALRDSLQQVGHYPDPTVARRALAKLHHRDDAEVLPTAGAAEAFGLVARLRDWQHPVVVHPQFTEPDVALTEAGHPPTHVLLTVEAGFQLNPAKVPESADLVVIGNPTNPTGVLHPAATIEQLLRPGRLVVVDEAFLDDERESLAGKAIDGLAVVRSLTKLWAIPGVRAGYLLGDPATVTGLRSNQTPWSVSTPAIAAIAACTTDVARALAEQRVAQIGVRRALLTDALDCLRIPYVAGSAAPFVLAKPGSGAREALRDKGFAVRRADTFPGLDDTWVRIAVRAPDKTEALLEALSALMDQENR